MASLTSLVALSIDTVLPALSSVSADLSIDDPAKAGLIVSFLVLGVGLGQMVYGPVSDTTGRKPALIAGLLLFILGSIVCLLAGNLTAMLSGRLLQGLGLAGPRIVCMAMVRDQYRATEMARVMSLIMTIFIIVPMLAPALGQLILALSSWRAIFLMLLGMGAILLAWFALRQPETLSVQARRDFSVRLVTRALGDVLRIRASLGYTLLSGVVYGLLLSYLTTAQPILQGRYSVGAMFAAYFAVIAGALGLASYTNGRAVSSYGMSPLVRRALAGLAVLCASFLLWTVAAAGQPPLWSLILFFMGAFFCAGLCFGNLAALAMEPLGHIAGLGAGVVGLLSTGISVTIATFLSHLYHGSLERFIAGYLACAIVANVGMHWISRRADP